MTPISLAIAIDRATPEIAQKTLRDIQVETAYIWAGRAIVAEGSGRRADATEYAHEAIEHAALSGNNFILGELRAAFEQYGIR